MKTVTHEQFRQELKSQGVELEHYAVKCPSCGTIQSPTSLIKAGAGADFNAVQTVFGFSCVGRYTGAGSAYVGKVKRPPGTGCNWTLGGLFQIHKYEVVFKGETHPHFELATPAEAQALRDAHAASEAACPT